MFDVIIKKGYVIDGMGNPWIKEDVAIDDGKMRARALLKARAEGI